MDGWDVPGYTALRELGAGAFGRVVLATRDADGRRVAVKCLTDAGRREEFAEEARLLGAVRSRHVVRLVEYVDHGGSPAIVMELLSGRTLKEVLAAQGALRPETALALFREILRGLSDAHRAGVVHRDCKPSNVLISERGAATLVDFGVAGRVGEEAASIGTPAYMPPEQWQGMPASPSGDLYAATAVLFECLTGHRPYQGRYLPHLAAQHLHAPIPDEEVPESLRHLVRRGLAKLPEDRPADAVGLLSDVESTARRAYGRFWDRRGRAAFAEVPTYGRLRTRFFPTGHWALAA
ncbi:serine/threonine-protein kinase [Actinocorallia sp. B10E7]|uniref:serine/threonine-protein kinase n=1 Tax=Actinocorallia sp. B10E7 TaxID=3153558 RepID=UPI00325D2D09